MGPSASELAANAFDVLKSSSTENVSYSETAPREDFRQENIPPSRNLLTRNINNNNNPSRCHRVCAPHKFKVTSFLKPKVCPVCSEKFGFQKKVLKCTLCDFSCHRQCEPQAPPTCGPFSSLSLNPMKIFGVSLEEVIRIDQKEYKNTEIVTLPNIPMILSSCIGNIEARGLHMPGIYRISGQTTAVEMLKTYFTYGLPQINDFE
eukprot:Sdes_comp16522_c0_seq2m5838